MHDLCASVVLLGIPSLFSKKSLRARRRTLDRAVKLRQPHKITRLSARAVSVFDSKYREEGIFFEQRFLNPRQGYTAFLLPLSECVGVVNAAAG